MTTYLEPARPYDFVLTSQGSYSCDTVTLAAAAGALAAGSVIGRISKVAARANIPTIVGTGTGLMTALSCGRDVQVGNYVVTLLATAADAAFSVVAPDGSALPNGAVGTAYRSNHVSFSIADGVIMTVGDKYTIVVQAAQVPVLVGTGTGVVSGVTLGPDAQNGTYRVQLAATAADAAFTVTAPDGTPLHAGKVAAAYSSSHINFTLANGGTMTTGDYFHLIVANGNHAQAKLWDPAAVDGTQHAIGITTHAADASAAAVAVTAITRAAEVDANGLAWKAGITAAQRQAAYRQFAAAGIVVRS